MSAHCKYTGSETTSFYSPEHFFFGSRSGKYAFRFESRTLNTWYYLIGIVCCRPRTVVYTQSERTGAAQNVVC